MNREIIPKLKKIISEAKHEAKSMDDIVVKPEHILIAILSDNNNGCSDALKNMQISLSLLNDCIFLE
jgi:ATP-dependent Clp protease ATP-binding subunit ClpA